MIGKGVYVQPPGPAPAYILGAVALEVEVDRETAQFRIGKLAAAVDCGKAVNPAAAEGQIEGSGLFDHKAYRRLLSEA